MRQFPQTPASLAAMVEAGMPDPDNAGRAAGFLFLLVQALDVPEPICTGAEHLLEARRAQRAFIGAVIGPHAPAGATPPLG